MWFLGTRGPVFKSLPGRQLLAHLKLRPYDAIQGREITHAQNRNPETDLDTILHGGRYPRRSYLHKFWWPSVKGFLGGGGSNFPFSHWLLSSPLQHSRTTVRACDCESAKKSVSCFNSEQYLRRLKSFTRFTFGQTAWIMLRFAMCRLCTTRSTPFWTSFLPRN